MALAVGNSIPFPRSSRRADTSVALAVTRPDILRRKFRERGNTQSYQPFAGLPQKAFLAQEMQTLPQGQEFGLRRGSRTFSSPTRAPVEILFGKEYRMDCGRRLDLAHPFPEVSIAERNSRGGTGDFLQKAKAR